MILVDTSVLLDFFKGVENSPATKFRMAVESGVSFGITSQVLQEVLQGARDQAEYDLLQDYLVTQKFYHPKDPINSYVEAAGIYYQCRKKGVTIRSTIDCFIAQIALEHDLSLLHNDRDFELMATVVPLRQY